MLTPSPLAALLLFTLACQGERGTEAPAEGWANVAPARVLAVVDAGEDQVIEVQEAQWRFWAQVPDVGVRPGDFVLLGRGTERYDVALPGGGERVGAVVDIEEVRVVDEEAARAAVRGEPPEGAVPVEEVFARLDELDGQEIVVYGTAVKATAAVGSVWVHLQDGTGDSEAGTHDLMVQVSEPVEAGTRRGFRGRLAKDADLGFGYRYRALLEEAEGL